MKDALQGFRWDVFPAYEWKDWLKEGRPVVVSEEQYRSRAGVSRAEELYGVKETGPVLGMVLDCGRPHTIKPMAEVALFQTFAKLNYADPDEILAFAHTHGNLRRSEYHSHQDLSGGHLTYGESHLQWAVEIEQMREALRLSRNRSPEQERDFLKAWTTEDHRRAKIKPPTERDRKRLTALINHRLEQVHPGIVMGESNRLSYGPSDLLSSMWLQFTLTLTGDRSFRQCKMCEKLFEISTTDEGYNANREFCDRDYCRLKHHRKRKQLALQLAFSKPRPSLSSIAKTVGSDAKTVRGWIKAKKAGC